MPSFLLKGVPEYPAADVEDAESAEDAEDAEDAAAVMCPTLIVRSATLIFEATCDDSWVVSALTQ